jgi:hypothetical protein
VNNNTSIKTQNNFYGKEVIIVFSASGTVDHHYGNYVG